MEGAEKLDALGRTLRDTGDKTLRRNLLAQIRKSAAPLTAEVRASMEATLPKEGGLAHLVANDTKIKVSTRLIGNKAGVRITATLPGHDLRAIDRGRLRHPVYGNRKAWVEQQVEPGCFSRPIKAGAPRVREAIVNLIDETSRSLHV